MSKEIQSEKLELFESDTVNPLCHKEQIKFLHNYSLQPSLVLLDKKYYYVGDEGVAEKICQIFFNFEPLKDLSKCKYYLPDGCKVSVEGDNLCKETLNNPYNSINDFNAILNLHLKNSNYDEFYFRNAILQNSIIEGWKSWLDSQNEITSQNLNQEILIKESLFNYQKDVF